MPQIQCYSRRACIQSEAPSALTGQRKQAKPRGRGGLQGGWVVRDDPPKLHEERVIYFGKYELLSRINIGGMAEIVKARDTSAGDRIVAIKRILPHLCADEHYRAMFLDESRVLAKLQHPSIVQALEIGELEATPYLALEYVAGQDAREVFLACEREGQPMPLGIACYLIARVCEGLQYVHDRTDDRGKRLGIVHRDVSLQNVLVGYDGEVKLTDFGIAVSAVNEVRTEAGIVKGKFGYMSPEQIRGAKLDQRSDVFATGICLYELLTGERLFSGDNDYKAVERVRQADVPRPSARNRQIPSTLENIILKALAKSPRDRYASANDLRRALQAFLAEAKLFIERKDLADYMQALFEREYLSAQQGGAAGRVGPADPSQGQRTALQPLPPATLREKGEATIVSAGVPAPQDPGAASSVEDLGVFAHVPAPIGHSPVPEAMPADSPLPPALLDDDDEDTEGATLPRGAGQQGFAPTHFDMDWDEQEPTTVSKGFREVAPLLAASAATRSAPAPSEQAGSDVGRAHARAAVESISSAASGIGPTAVSSPASSARASSTSTQRSLPTLEIRRPREPRTLVVALASLCVALAVFLGVSLLRDRADAAVRIDTDPPDAVVYIDGRRLPGERGPYIASKLTSSERHTIVVERSGYTSWSTTIKLPAGEILAIPLVRLEALAADRPTLADDSQRAAPTDAAPQPASAEVPAEEPAPAAQRSVRPPSRPKRAPIGAAHAPKVISTKVAAPSNTGASPPDRQAAAPTEGGTLRINTRPWSVVSVDGVRVGNTPQTNIKVKAGQHTLKLENAEFGISQELTVTVQPGQTVTRVITLRP